MVWGAGEMLGRDSGVDEKRQLLCTHGHYIAVFPHCWKLPFINILDLGQLFNTSKLYHIKEP